MVGARPEDEWRQNSQNRCYTGCQKIEENKVDHASPGNTRSQRHRGRRTDSGGSWRQIEANGNTGSPNELVTGNLKVSCLSSLALCPFWCCERLFHEVKKLHWLGEAELIVILLVLYHLLGGTCQILYSRVWIYSYFQNMAGSLFSDTICICHKIWLWKSQSHVGLYAHRSDCSIKNHTLGIMVCCWNEYKVAWFHILFSFNRNWQRIKEIRLIPRTDAKAEVMSEISQHTSQQTAAVQEQRRVILSVYTCTGSQTVTAASSTQHAPSLHHTAMFFNVFWHEKKNRTNELRGAYN